NGLEGEVSQELDRRCHFTRHLPPGGVALHVPLDAPLGIEQRTGILNTSTGAGGVANVLSPTVIDVLRARTGCARLGAKMETDLKGASFAFPRRTATVSLGYVSEGNAVSISNQTLDSPSLNPRTVGCYTDVTRRFLKSAPNGETITTEDLLAAVAVE